MLDEANANHLHSINQKVYMNIYWQKCTHKEKYLRLSIYHCAENIQTSFKSTNNQHDRICTLVKWHLSFGGRKETELIKYFSVHSL